jgi:hypothetical protein
MPTVLAMRRFASLRRAFLAAPLAAARVYASPVPLTSEGLAAAARPLSVTVSNSTTSTTDSLDRREAKRQGKSGSKRTLRSRLREIKDADHCTNLVRGKKLSRPQW